MEGRTGVLKEESIRTLSFDEVIDRLISLYRPYHDDYLAMYSSWYGGIVRDAALMTVPIDDHLVHRGDGVFEAFKCVGWKVYALNRHLNRMEWSAKTSSLAIPVERPQLERIILETIRAANVPDCLIRLYLSRGPGGFSTNPYECPASQLYIVVATLKTPSDDKYRNGVHIRTSLIPMKRDYFANIKSCNYLPNVFMTKEAQDAGVDFTISLDERGFLGEGATENVGIISKEGEFLVPKFDRILRGITISRVLELAQELVKTGDLRSVREADISLQEAYGATEVMIFGTTCNVLPVVSYDDHRIGDGKPGSLFRKFLELLGKDMRNGAGMVTPVKE